MVPKSDAYMEYLDLELAHRTEERGAAYWQRVRKLLIRMLRDHQDFVRRNLELASGPSDQPPLPLDLSELLVRALHRLADGESDSLLAPHKLTGGRGNWRSNAKEGCIWWAVAYATVVDAGWAVDSRSRQTIAEAFQVSRRQVQRWLLAAGSLPTSLKDLKLRFPPIRREGESQYKVRVAGIVKKLMPAKGADYARIRKSKSAFSR